MKVTTRKLFIVLFTAAALLFLASLYFEFVENLNPCPLCILQRTSVLLLAILGFMAMVQNPKKWGSAIYVLFGVSVSLFGLSVALRQTWLQYFDPNPVTSCGMSFAYMLVNLPLEQTLHLIFAGSGECNVVTWSFLGLSMAAWLVFIFIGFIAAYLWVFKKAMQQS